MDKAKAFSAKLTQIPFFLPFPRCLFASGTHRAALLPENAFFRVICCFRRWPNRPAAQKTAGSFRFPQFLSAL